MTTRPIDLDSKRDARNRQATALRRKIVLRSPTPANDPLACNPDPEMLAEMMIGRAGTLAEALAKVRFLLARYAASPLGGDLHTQTLIRRVLSDLARLQAPGNTLL